MCVLVVQERERAAVSIQCVLRVAAARNTLRAKQAAAFEAQVSLHTHYHFRRRSPRASGLNFVSSCVVGGQRREESALMMQRVYRGHQGRGEAATARAVIEREELYKVSTPTGA